MSIPSKWSWKTCDLMLIQSWIGLCFGISTMIIIHHDDEVCTKQETSCLILNFLGFIGLMFLQIRNKWIFGVIVISILLLLSVYRILDCYKIL